MTEKTKRIGHFRELEVYRKAFAAAMQIFQLTKAFPAEGKFSLYEHIINMLNSMERQADKFCY